MRQSTGRAKPRTLIIASDETLRILEATMDPRAFALVRASLARVPSAAREYVDADRLLGQFQGSVAGEILAQMVQSRSVEQPARRGTRARSRRGHRQMPT